MTTTRMPQKPLRTVWTPHKSLPEWSLCCRSCGRKLAIVQVSELPDRGAFFWATITLGLYGDWRADYAPTFQAAKTAARKAVTHLLAQFRERQVRYAQPPKPPHPNLTKKRLAWSAGKMRLV